VVPLICLAGIAGTLTAYGQCTDAAKLLGTVAGVWRDEEQPGVNVRPYHLAYEPALAATRAALSPEAFAQAWAEGQALSLNEAVALALAALPGDASV
jgi:hypothetical protein